MFNIKWKHAAAPLFSFAVLALYLIAHLIFKAKFGENITDKILGVVATSAGLATSLWFLYELFTADDAEMGKFIADRTAIIIGVWLMCTFTAVNLFQSFAKLTPSYAEDNNSSSRDCSQASLSDKAASK